jgi:hypothetical protein
LQFLGFKPQLILIMRVFLKLNKVVCASCTSGKVCYCGWPVKSDEKCLLNMLKMFNCGLQRKKIVIYAVENNLIRYAKLYLLRRVFLYACRSAFVAEIRVLSQKTKSMKIRKTCSG